MKKRQIKSIKSNNVFLADIKIWRDINEHGGNITETTV